LRIPSGNSKSIDGKFKNPHGKLRIPSRKSKSIDGKFKKLDDLFHSANEN